MKRIGGLMIRRERKRKRKPLSVIITKTHLLFQLEAFHLVLILEGSLLDLKSLEALETPFDLGG